MKLQYKNKSVFGEILPEGTFAFAFVVGFTAIYVAFFVPLVRGVMYYLTAILFPFYVYLSAKTFLWQTIDLLGFVFYLLDLYFGWTWGR